MHISPFLFFATCLVPYVFAHGAPPSQEDSLTSHAHLRTREDLAEVSDLHRRAPPKAAPKPAKPVAAAPKKPVAAVAKKPAAAIPNKPAAAVNKKPVAAVSKKPVAAASKKPVAAVSKKPVAAASKKPVGAVNKKPVAAASKKPVGAVNKKPVAAASKKPVGAVNKKPVAASSKKPVAAVNKKPVAAASKKPVGAVNKKPVAASSKKPVVEAVNKKPVAAASKKPVGAVNKKPVAAASKKPVGAVSKKPVAASSKKPLATAPKKPAAAAQREKVAATKPAAGVNGKTAAVGTKAAVKQSGAACGRRVHRRSIYNDLYGRTECEIQLNLKDHATKQMHTETIKVRPSQNLGASDGIISANNRAVYKIDKWNGQQGPFIAKQFNSDKDKSKEAGNLAKVGHLIAASPKDSPDDNSWAVMKHVPGKPLIGSPEHAAAMAKPKAEANAWMQQKHQQLANTVDQLHKNTGLLHADLKNDNVHWEHHSDGSSTPHLLDFGQMAKSEADMKNVYKMNGVPKDKESPQGYALHRAQAIYPLKQ